MVTSLTSPATECLVIRGINRTIVTLDPECRTIRFDTASGQFNYASSQILSVDVVIEPAPQVLYKVRSTLSRSLLCGALGQILARWQGGRRLRRMGVALCQRQFVQKIAHRITVNDSQRTTYDLVFLDRVARCGAPAVKAALTQSGLWLARFYQSGAGCAGSTSP